MEDNPSAAKSDAWLLGVAFDLTSSYNKGAEKGPHAILDAGMQVELETPLFGTKLTDKVRTHNLGILEYLAPVKNGNLVPFSSKEIKIWSEAMVKDVKQQAKQALLNKKLFILLGGEHSTLVGALEAVSEVYSQKQVTVLHFDAHLDLRDSLNGNKLSHACALRRVRDFGFENTVHVGIRDHVSEEEARYVQENKLADSVFYCASMPKAFYEDQNYKYDNTFYNRENLVFSGVPSERQVARIAALAAGRKFLWITIDVDGITPESMPGTGTPLPLGLTYQSVCDVLYAVLKECRRKKVKLLGFDIQEVAPLARDLDKRYASHRTGSTATGMNAAFLSYKIFSDEEK